MESLRSSSALPAVKVHDPEDDRRLEEVSAGEIYIGEKLVNDVAPKNRDIAMVFQEYALYPHMTAYDNIAFSLRMRGFSKGDIEKRVRETSVF